MTTRMGTPKHVNDDGGEQIASDTDNQETEKQDNPSRPSEINKIRMPIQFVCIQNIDLIDPVIVNETVQERVITRTLFE